jgi:hypothetical protein
MPNFIDLTGQTFGRLLVLKRANVKKNEAFWICKCICGNIITTRGIGLRQGSSKSCGCYMREVSTKTGKKLGKLPKKLKHGKVGSQVYQTWANIKQRCFNPKCIGYIYYGGRGIVVYKPWIKSFLAFYEYIGDPPSNKHSLDRINNNGNYEPGNIRWATDKVQQCNKRTNHMINYNGKTQNITTWAKELGIPFNTIIYRLKSGLTFEQAIKKKCGGIVPKFV